jgi:hypothetical protein
VARRPEWTARPRGVARIDAATPDAKTREADGGVRRSGLACVAHLRSGAM